MLKKHQTPTYIYHRLRQMIFEYRQPNAPWLTEEAVSLLDRLIQSEDRGVEFGSGRSTKWLAQRCGHLLSVEHHKGWYEEVRSQIKELKNVDYLWGDLKNDEPEASDYIKVMKEVADDSIDFSLIDGKYRGILSLISIKKLKRGGLLILDNAERYLPNHYKLPSTVGAKPEKLSVKWEEFYRKTKSWRSISTTNGVSSTIIYFKP